MFSAADTNPKILSQGRSGRQLGIPLVAYEA